MALAERLDAEEAGFAAFLASRGVALDAATAAAADQDLEAFWRSGGLPAGELADQAAARVADQVQLGVLRQAARERERVRDRALGEAAVFVGAATAVQDMAPDDRRGEAASYFSVALYAGLAIGPVMGETVFEASGYRAVWWAAAAAATVAAALGTRAPVGTLSEPKPGPWLHRAALGPGFVLLLGLLPFVGFASFIALYGEDIGVDDTASCPTRCWCC